MTDEWSDWPWSYLGLEPGATEREVKRAYAARLKQTRPQDDPDGFQQLRAAYDVALQIAVSGQNAETEAQPLSLPQPADPGDSSAEIPDEPRETAPESMLTARLDRIRDFNERTSRLLQEFEAALQLPSPEQRAAAITRFIQSEDLDRFDVRAAISDEVLHRLLSLLTDDEKAPYQVFARREVFHHLARRFRWIEDEINLGTRFDRDALESLFRIIDPKRKRFVQTVTAGPRSWLRPLFTVLVLVWALYNFFSLLMKIDDQPSLGEIHALLTNGDYTAANAHAVAFFKHNSRSGDALILQALARVRAGSPESACAPLQIVAERGLDWRVSMLSREPFKRDPSFDPEVVQRFMGAAELCGPSADLANAFAWLLATSTRDEVRNSSEALRWALKATAAQEDNLVFLDTLAAAYAEQGDFSNAVATQERVVQTLQARLTVMGFAQRSAWERNLEEMKSRLEQYRRNEPYRESS